MPFYCKPNTRPSPKRHALGMECSPRRIGSSACMPLQSVQLKRQQLKLLMCRHTRGKVIYRNLDNHSARCLSRNISNMSAETAYSYGFHARGPTKNLFLMQLLPSFNPPRSRSWINPLMHKPDRPPAPTRNVIHTTRDVCILVLSSCALNIKSMQHQVSIMYLKYVHVQFRISS